RASEKSDVGEDLGGVALGFHLVVDLLDPAIGAYDEGGALDAHHLLAVHVLLLPDAVGLGGGLVFVGKEGEGEVILRLEFRLGGGLVGGYPEDGGILSGE